MTYGEYSHDLDFDLGDLGQGQILNNDRKWSITLLISEIDPRLLLSTNRK